MFSLKTPCRISLLRIAALLLLLGLTLIFPRLALAQRPMGVDVSSHQKGCIDWSAVKSSGRSFAFIKAAEGDATDGWIGQDPDFVINQGNAKAAGVYVSYYYYCHPESDPGTAGADAEAAFFWNVIKNYTKADGLTMMPMLDFEQDVTTASPAYTAASLSAWLNQWCNDVVNYGKSASLNIKPIVYTFPCYVNGGCGYGPGVDSSVTQWPLNMATVSPPQDPQTGAPNPTPWSNWAFWQYDWYGTVPGIDNRCGGTTNTDMDVFNGSTNQMTNTYLITGIGPTITSQPTSVSVPVGSNVTFTVTSANATHYQWQFNGTNLAGATTNHYTLNNVQLTNAGTYLVVVTNKTGITLSSNALLSVVGSLTNAPGAAFAPANMVDWWPAEGNALDIFGTHNGTPEGNFFYTPGKSGLAFHFDGSTTYVATGEASLPPPWTVCMWVNYSHTGKSSGALLEDGTNCIKLEQYGSATHNVGISQIGYLDSTFNYAVPINTWTHLAFVGTPTSVTLYANGVSQGSITTNSFPLPLGYIGAGHVPSTGLYIDNMLGSMDDLMTFNRALTATEISSIYNAGSAGLIRAPQFLSAQSKANGLFLLHLEGLTGKTVTLSSSTNFTTWSNVTTITLTSGTNAYIISHITNAPRAFYRLSQPY